MQYLNFLDGLRAMAVISVVLYHLNARWVPNGFLGVDMFFVISGFIVSYSVASRGSVSFPTFVADFYARRFIRILPALIVCILFTGIASFLFIPDVWLSGSQDKTGSYALLGLSNIVLSKGVDYFSPITEFNPFTHTWSLGVEEQFYFLFPLLFFPWMVKSTRAISSMAYLVPLIASAGIWYRLTTTNPLLAFYMIYGRFWELAVGVLCFQAMSILHRKSNPLPVVAQSMAFAGIVLLGFSLFYTPPSHLGWLSNVAVVISTALLIATLQQFDVSKSIFSVLQTPLIRFVGKISYSLYLWHWPVFVLARWTTGLDTPMQLASCLVIAVTLSIMSYFFVEMPSRKSRTLYRLPRFATVAAGLASIAISWSAFSFGSSYKNEISMSVVTRDRLAWKADIPRVTYEDLPGCFAQNSIEGIEFHFTRLGCGETSSPRRVYFLGDSHSYVYQNMMRRFTLITGVESVLVNTDGCTFLSLQWARDNDPNCLPSTRRAVDNLYAKVKPGDLIFLPSLRLPRLAQQFEQYTDESAMLAVYGPGSAENRAKAVENAIDTLRPLAQKGVHFLFEAPLPVFRSASFRCSDWFNRSNPACSAGLSIEREFILRLRQPTLDGFSEIAKVIPHVRVWDPLPTICPNERCEMFRDGKPLFSDGDHISAYSTILLTASFVEAASRNPVDNMVTAD